MKQDQADENLFDAIDDYLYMPNEGYPTGHCNPEYLEALRLAFIIASGISDDKKYFTVGKSKIGGGSVIKGDEMRAHCLRCKKETDFIEIYRTQNTITYRCIHCGYTKTVEI